MASSSRNAPEGFSPSLFSPLVRKTKRETDRCHPSSASQLLTDHSCLSSLITRKTFCLALAFAVPLVILPRLLADGVPRLATLFSPSVPSFLSAAVVLPFLLGALLAFLSLFLPNSLGALASHGKTRVAASSPHAAGNAPAGGTASSRVRQLLRRSNEEPREAGSAERGRTEGMESRVSSASQGSAQHAIEGDTREAPESRFRRRAAAPETPEDESRGEGGVPVGERRRGTRAARDTAQASRLEDGRRPVDPRSQQESGESKGGGMRDGEPLPIPHRLHTEDPLSSATWRGRVSRFLLTPVSKRLFFHFYLVGVLVCLVVLLALSLSLARWRLCLPEANMRAPSFASRAFREDPQADCPSDGHGAQEATRTQTFGDAQGATLAETAQDLSSCPASSRGSTGAHAGASPAASEQESPVEAFDLLSPLVLFFVHCSRRLLEQLFVVRPHAAASQMTLAAYLLGVGFYLAVPLALGLGSLRAVPSLSSRCLEKAVLTSLPSFCLLALAAEALGEALAARWAAQPVASFASLVAFLLINWIQLYSHLRLARLRPASSAVSPDSRATESKCRKSETMHAAPRDASGAYGIPRGGLFAFVSCPHYLAEILIYFYLFLLLPSSEMLACLAFVTTTMFVNASKTHAWYRRTFGDEYPP
ncbi:3-oxo-5-alpha-steroid 4-dehydrogenase family protein, related [Neospora caninum Liverpool]|uniref:3-oxo-5-alpha-steroid 4-dehydrogenase family protein, related n=1 Tax=Neospora caninum (strain Liverpool) TaxID=572307 RepID=F0VJ16_NEOCL|nr:3-oxo-5-alpha-steroid 4-dehydrogenase family protein, related [Neospora caninum Liverpool]CBZ53727.1 3-oxo-5-alpha-steroid 4-dehydrogenase family protein, related [Neospora caninum Liverpool]|eukprot:XP_003883759.1 3-oxo-5-alpha-steroid 4-dehydrogenase family protein, related [Neospora caninum Liverpool]